MNQTNLYEIIFKRKSIRKYDLTSISENELAEISAYMKTLKPMYDNIETEMKIVPQKDMKSLMPIKAPHYILVFAENKDGYLTNVGFMLQQMDLFLSSNGFGSCWLGMAKPKKEIVNDSKLEFIITLAFGKPVEALHRGSVSEYKRKPLEQIRSIMNVDELIEPARIAPSGMNSQAWFFTGSDSVIHAYCAKPGFIKAVLAEGLEKIDMGIAICHLWIAAKHFGKDIEFVSDKVAQDNSPNGHYYIISLKIK